MMGWLEAAVCCPKHPDHRRSNGVCPSCLRDKLAQLSTGHSPPSSASASMRFHESDFSSPGFGSGRRTVLMMLRGNGADAEIKRCLSMAAVAPEDDRQEEGSKGRGLWRRLVGSVRRRKQKSQKGRISHSKTVRERPPVDWVM